MTRHTSLVGITVACAVLGGAIVWAEGKPEALAMRLSAVVAPINSDVVVRTRVEPDTRSRQLVVEWVADDLSGGSHLESLDGARAAATHQYVLKHMSPGQYVVTAILSLSDGREVRRAEKLLVVGAEQLDRNAAPGGSRRPASRR